MGTVTLSPAALRLLSRSSIEVPTSDSFGPAYVFDVVVGVRSLKLYPLSFFFTPSGDSASLFEGLNYLARVPGIRLTRYYSASSKPDSSLFLRSTLVFRLKVSDLIAKSTEFYGLSF